MLTKNEIFDTLKKLNLKSNDAIMIHSSLRSIGEIEGRAEGLLDALKEYFKDGLIMIPSHTWSFMNKDGQVLDLNEPNSCVGELANVALREGFVRSFHPTHSIVAWGKNANEYIKNDDISVTPTNPDGCFGRLHEIDAKILFLGALLSKNTFIHTIEEFFGVGDRLSQHVYTFYTKKGNDIRTYHVHKHECSINPHISEHYMKLEKPMIKLGIAKYFKFGDANSIIVNSKECYNLVYKLLNQDIHLFDTPDEIDEKLYINLK